MAAQSTPSSSGSANSGKSHKSVVEGRSLVLCFDGTAGQYDNDNSNVVKFFALLNKDPNEQLCYYQPGIGTWFKPGMVSPLLHWGAKLMDLAIAWYLDEHVLEGYRFVMQNYRAGDKICLFGFSRGAYTARALAGMLHKVGLLPRDNDAQMPFAYALFKREDAEGLELCEGFKRTYCQDVKIEFVGVWDTVASVGVIASRTLPFTNSNSSIRVFRHALALDEHRARFRPNLYHRMTSKFASHANAPMEKSASLMRKKSAGTPRKVSPASSSNTSTESVPKSSKRKSLITRFSFAKRPDQVTFATPPASPVEGSDDVLEVWFAGCHSDIGGGSVRNDAPNALSNIALRWMVRQASLCGSGVRFDEAALARANISVHAEVDENEDELDKADALQPINDALKITPAWWILEVMPMTYVWQDKDGFWHRTFKWNLGKGRKIEEHRPNFHETVRMRSSHEGLGYKPKARWEAGKEVYVR